MNVTEHLLDLLKEECAEITQRACKTTRFGLDEIQSGQLQTNTEQLAGEIIDLLAVVELLEENGVIYLGSEAKRRIGIEAKREKIERFMEYSRQQRTLT